MLNKIASITIFLSLLLMSEITFLHATPMVIEKSEKAIKSVEKLVNIFDVGSKIRRGTHRS